MWRRHLILSVLQRGRPVGEVVAAMLAEANLPVPENLTYAAWHGTPPLTNHPSRVAGERLFLVGDAGGYVEPFTGEGIAAALESASAVVPIAARACRNWDDSLATSMGADPLCGWCASDKRRVGVWLGCCGTRLPSRWPWPRAARILP